MTTVVISFAHFRETFADGRTEISSSESVGDSEESRSVHEDDSFLDGFPPEIQLSESWIDVTVTDIDNPGHFTVRKLIVALVHISFLNESYCLSF